MINQVKAVWPWFGNVVEAVYTVAHGMWITLRTWFKTYQPERKTFTEHFEYPELPVPVAARYRGFHRFDLTTCIACDQCAKACPVDCIYIGKERVDGRQGLQDHRLHDRLHEVHVLCVVRRALPGGLHLHGRDARLELLQPRRMHRRFFAAAAGRGLGPGDAQPDGGGRFEGDHRAGARRTESIGKAVRMRRDQH